MLGALPLPEEERLRDALPYIEAETLSAFRQENFELAVAGLASLRTTIDAFFEEVTVNDPVPELRRNRLRLLARFRDTVNQIADFSRVEV